MSRLQRVKPGDPLRIHADTMNGLLDLLQPNLGAGAAAPTFGYPIDIRVRNTLTHSLGRFSAARIIGPAFTLGDSTGSIGPHGTQVHFGKLVSHPFTFDVGLPENATDPVCVLQRTIEPDGVGPARVLGVTPCYLDAADTNSPMESDGDTPTAHAYVQPRTDGFLFGNASPFKITAAGPGRILWKRPNWAGGALAFIVLTQHQPALRRINTSTGSATLDTTSGQYTFYDLQDQDPGTYLVLGKVTYTLQDTVPVECLTTMVVPLIGSGELAKDRVESPSMGAIVTHSLAAYVQTTTIDADITIRAQAAQNPVPVPPVITGDVSWSVAVFLLSRWE
jgi:hypothetical protein